MTSAYTRQCRPDPHHDAIEQLIHASDLIARKLRDPRSQVLVRDNPRNVVDVLDEVGLNTDSAQRGQDVPGNARVFVLVVGLRAAGSSSTIEWPNYYPPCLVQPRHTGTHSVSRRDARSASGIPILRRQSPALQVPLSAGYACL